MSQIVKAAIAFTGAPTATFAPKVNRQDHATVRKALRPAKILGHEDEAQYGASRISQTRAW